MGLLILRLTIAGTIKFLTLSLYYTLIESTFRGWLIGVVSLVASAIMIAGFLTPLISVLILISGVLFLILSPRGIDFFFVIYLILLSLSILFLGPGAYSVDAKLFGRREIILAKEPSDPGGR